MTRATILSDQQIWAYVVQKGDTLSAIGERPRIHWTKLASHNRMRNPNLIFPGDLIFIPKELMQVAT